MKCLKKQKVILAVLLLLLTSLLAISGSMPIIETVETFFNEHSHTHSHENGNRPHHHSFDFKGSGSTSQDKPIPQKNLMNYKEAWKNLKKRDDGHLSGNGYKHVGHPNESEIINVKGPNNKYENLWKASSNFVQNVEGNRDTGPDGGWNYTINGVTPESGYLSIVYFKVPKKDKRKGKFYHGPAHNGGSLKTDGTPNGYEYFEDGIQLYDFKDNEWYVSIGIILPYREGGYSPDSPELETIGGIYNLTTVKQFIPTNKNKKYKNFMMNPDKTTQMHRAFQHYSPDPNSEIHFARPGFYKMDGSEPRLEDILNLQNID
jgi:hypothetical protein